MSLLSLLLVVAVLAGLLAGLLMTVAIEADAGPAQRQPLPPSAQVTTAPQPTHKAGEADPLLGPSAAIWLRTVQRLAWFSLVTYGVSALTGLFGGLSGHL